MVSGLLNIDQEHFPWPDLAKFAAFASGLVIAKILQTKKFTKKLP